MLLLTLVPCEAPAVIAHLNVKPVVVEMLELYHGKAGIRMFYDVEEQLTHTIKEQNVQLLIPDDK